MFKVNNKDWCLYCWLWTYFTPCSSVSIIKFEHVIARCGWDSSLLLIWFCYWCMSYKYDSIFSLECFSFVKAPRISEKSFCNKFNSSLSEWPKNFNYLFILLIRNSVHLNLNAMSRKLKKKKKRTHLNFNMKY